MKTPDARFSLFAHLLLGGTAFLLMFGIVRVVQLQIAPSDELQALMGTRTTSRIELHGRGSITDRRGRLIAFTEIGQRIYVDASLVWEEGLAAGESDPFERIAIQVHERTGMDADAIYASLLRTLAVDAEQDELVSRSRYVVLDDDASDAVVDALRSEPIRGLVVQKRPLRRHPYTELAQQLLGRVGPGEGRTQTGRTGIEMALHRDMKPSHGRLEYVRDRGGSPMFVPEDGYTRGEDGRSVQLTIDMELQRKAEQLITQAVEDHQAVGGWLLLLDPRNGEILAAADVFSNAEARSRGGWPEAWLDPLRDTSPSMARNRCWTDPFEPGSTFKPFFWSWATMHEKAQPEEILPTPGGGYGTVGVIFKDGRRSRRIKDAYGKEKQDWSTSLVKSLNTAMAMVAQRMSSIEMQSMIREFGFRDKTGISLPGETRGLITAPERWDALYTHLSVSFGQEIAVTPLQLARAFCVFAREDGSIPLVRITRQPGSNRFAAPALPVISNETVLLTREVLARVMSPEGTGRNARSMKYSIFGKSGTPQMPNTRPAPGEKGYFEDRYMPNFLAAAPVVAPRIVVACGLQDPRKGAGANLDHNGHGYGGGYSAGRVARDMIDFSLEYLGVPGDLQHAALNTGD